MCAGLRWVVCYVCRAMLVCCVPCVQGYAGVLCAMCAGLCWCAVCHVCRAMLVCCVLCVQGYAGVLCAMCARLCWWLHGLCVQGYVCRAMCAGLCWCAICAAWAMCAGLCAVICWCAGPCVERVPDQLG